MLPSAPDSVFLVVVSGVFEHRLFVGHGIVEFLVRFFIQQLGGLLLFEPFGHVVVIGRFVRLRQLR